MKSVEGQAHQLLYPHDARMSPGGAGIAALQQVMAMFIGCITPVIIFSSNVEGIDAETSRYMISMALIASGIGTFLQARRFGLIGSGLLSINGTSFAYVTLLVEAGKQGGLPLACGMALAAVPFQFVLAFCLPYLSRVFSPLVAGIVVLLIGLDLLKVSGFYIAYGAADSGAWTPNLVIASVVVLTLIISQLLPKPIFRTCAPLMGILVGYIAAALFGMLSMPESTEGGFIILPQPLKYGLAFDAALLLPFMIIYLVSSLEAIGDLSATASLSGLKTEGPAFWKRIKGGILSDAITSTLATLCNVFPTATFSQNNGVIQLTGVGSRQVGLYVAGILVLLGLLPQTGAVLNIMPKPVLGGITMVLFGLVAGAGLRMIARERLGNREVLMIAISLGAALSIPSQEAFVQVLPELMQSVFSSAVATGGLVAVVLNFILLPIRKKEAGADEPGSEIDKNP